MSKIHALDIRVRFEHILDGIPYHDFVLDSFSHFLSVYVCLSSCSGHLQSSQIMDTSCFSLVTLNLELVFLEFSGSQTDYPVGECCSLICRDFGLHHKVAMWHGRLPVSQSSIPLISALGICCWVMDRLSFCGCSRLILFLFEPIDPTPAWI